MNKSQFPDGMHPRVLKELANVIASPLTTLWNVTAIGEVLIDKKDAKVTPIFKSKKEPYLNL